MRRFELLLPTGDQWGSGVAYDDGRASVRYRAGGTVWNWMTNMPAMAVAEWPGFTYLDEDKP